MGLLHEALFYTRSKYYITHTRFSSSQSMRFLTISTSLNSRATSLIHRIQRQLFSSGNGSKSESLHWKIALAGDPTLVPHRGSTVGWRKFCEQNRSFKELLRCPWITKEGNFPMSSYDAAVD